MKCEKGMASDPILTPHDLATSLLATREEMMRLGEAPSPGSLDPIEIASRDEIAALQTQRLKATLRHAYENVPAYRKKFEAAGVHPDDLQAARGSRANSRSPPRRICATTIPSACSPCRATRSCASTPRPARPASRPSSATPKATSTSGPTLMARSIRAVGRRARHEACTSPTATACSPAGSARITAPSSSAAP